jgi:hypothetical protein
VKRSVTEFFKQDQSQVNKRRAQQYHKDDLEREHIASPAYLGTVKK